MLSIDEAIKHCLEVAEENDLVAGTHEILAENNHNAYERLTAETNSSRCAECAADHRQLAEWLMELKDLREENKVLIQKCDRLIKEKGELNELKEKAVSDIWRREARLKESKRLLKAAVEDLKFESQCRNCKYQQTGLDNICNGCRGNKYEWRYADETEKLLNDEKINNVE